MFRNITRAFSATSRVTQAAVARSAVPDLSALKLDSIASQSLYSVVSIYNKKYLVTKGDKIILPFKMKNAEVGDLLVLNEVLTIGSPQYTYHSKSGIPQEVFNISAKVVEITREPYYEVVRRKQRCRRRKTIPVENFQTHLLINELKLN